MNRSIMRYFLNTMPGTLMDGNTGPIDANAYAKLLGETRREAE